MSEPSVDDLAELLRGPATNEIDSLLEELCFEDLTACELVTMATVLRAAWERKQAREKPPVVLKMVRTRKRRRA